MLAINGMTFKKKFLPTFIFVKDLQYFEGTLLAEYKTEKGDTYVFHWCDCSDILNRWLVVRISKRSLLQFESGLLSLYNLLYKDNLDETYYFLDMDTNQDIKECHLIQKESLENEYLPEQDTFIIPELIFDENENSYPILIDKDWKTEDLASFPRKFIDVCLLIKTYKSNIDITNDGTWNGGLASQAFYNKLRRENNGNLKIKAIQYASPGYIQFSTDRELGLLVKKNIDNYIENMDKIDAIFKRLTSYISDYELNKKPENLTDIHRVFFRKEGYELMKYFSQPEWSWILKISDDEFKAIKTAMSFYRRILFLAKRVLEKKAIFAKL
jgi:hypothetical protein